MSDYSIGFSYFQKIRSFSDGVSFFEFQVNLDRYLADHSPRFEIIFIILNFKIFELEVYYKHHRHE